MIIHSRLNVLFDDPFWVGIFEREYEGDLTRRESCSVRNRRIMRCMSFL